MIDINELRLLAQAATPGPWKVGQYLGSPRQFVIHVDVGDKGRGSDVAFTSANFGNDETIANASLLAAANPATISELLDRLETAERERDAAELMSLALRAKIEQMEKQEPVAWMQSTHLSSFKNRLCGSQSSYVHCSDHQLHPDFKPLYALPGAQPQLNEIKIALQRALELGQRETWTGARKHRSWEDQREEQQCWDKVWSLLGAKGESE